MKSKGQLEPGADALRHSRRINRAIYFIRFLPPDHADPLLQEVWNRCASGWTESVRVGVEDAAVRGHRYSARRSQLLSTASVLHSEALIDQALASLASGDDPNPDALGPYLLPFAREDPAVLERLAEAVHQGGYQAVLGSTVFAAAAGPPPSEPRHPWNDLVSFDPALRASAAADLHDQVHTVRRALVGYLRVLHPTTAAEHPAAFAVVSLTAGEWGASEATPYLIRFIHFDFPPSPPAAAETADPSDRYPAARALVRIGGREVIEAIFQNIARPATEDEASPLHERTLRPSAWVLREVLGQDLALAAIEIEKSKTDDPDILNALDRMRAWINQGGEILPPVGDQGPP